MAGQRIISKQLAGAEDLLLDASGESTVTQQRAGGIKTITKVNAESIPFEGKFGRDDFKSIGEVLKAKIGVVATIDELKAANNEIYYTIYVTDSSRGGLFVYDAEKLKEEANEGTIFASLYDSLSNKGCYIRECKEVEAEWFGDLNMQNTYIKAASLGLPVKVRPGSYTIDEDSEDLSEYKFYSFGDVEISSHSTLTVTSLV